MDFELVSQGEGDASKAGLKNTPWWKEHVMKVDMATMFPVDSGEYPLPPHICFMCGEQEAKDGALLKRCGACKACRYCSRGCQKKHWKYHKIYCGNWKEYNDIVAAENDGDKTVEPRKAVPNEVELSPEDKKLAALLESAYIETPRLKARHDYLAQATGRIAPSMSQKILEHDLEKRKQARSAPQ